MATHVQLKGTFYEVGHKLGQLRRSNIQAVVDHFKQSDLYTKIEDYRAFNEGERVYKQLEDTTIKHCADYVEELRGVANGAGVCYDDLFLYNIGPDLTAAFGIVPDGSHDVSYASIFAGCTNIALQTDDKEGLFVHTEDIDPFFMDKTLMISVEIVDSAGTMLEKWTEFTIPGEVPGSKFGYNHHGIMFGHNNIYLKGINKFGIPRRFMSRMLMTIRDPCEAKDILLKGPGISSAFTYFVMKRDPSTGDVCMTVLEAAGTDTGPRVVEIRPPPIYHHCNIFQNLSLECHPEESSVHRAAVISQYVNRGEVRTREDLLKIVSDQKDRSFPVYRTGQHLDYLQTGATGLFDARLGTMEVYLYKPDTTLPQHVLQIGE